MLRIIETLNESNDSMRGIIYCYTAPNGKVILDKQLMKKKENININVTLFVKEAVIETNRFIEQ